MVVSVVIVDGWLKMLVQIGRAAHTPNVDKLAAAAELLLLLKLRSGFVQRFLVQLAAGKKNNHNLPDDYSPANRLPVLLVQTI